MASAMAYDQRTLTGFAPSFAAPMQHKAGGISSYAPAPASRGGARAFCERRGARTQLCCRKGLF